MWEVEKDGKIAYLYGSIHIAKNDLFPLDDLVEMTFKEADYLSVEADISNIMEVQKLMPMMMYEGDDNLYNHLNDEQITKYEAMCKELGLDPALLERFKVWAVGSNILALQLAQSDYAGQAGIDMYFLQKAKEMDKPIVELEGVKFQFDLMNSFTDEEQAATFFDSLGSIEETTKGFDSLYSAFISGNLERVTSALMSEDDVTFENANVEKQMLHDRNIGMADKVEEYVSSGDTYFVVAGLAHYLGDDSVVQMLLDRGYSVKRIVK